MPTPHEPDAELSSSEKASWAAFNAAEEISTKIIDLAVERLKGQQVAGIALDTRITQVAFGQLAAAAFAGSFVTNAAATHASTWAAAFSCLLFAVGAGVAIVGVGPGRQQTPGIPPDWWFAPVCTGGEDLTPEGARAMAAEQLQRSLDVNYGKNETRAQLLIGSLATGLTGAGSVVLAAFLKAFGH